MSESVGDQWGEYLRVGRRMSEHTVDAYLGDLRAFLDYLGIGWDAPAGEFAHALTQRRIRSWLADTLVRGGARSTIARHTAAVRNFTAWAVREEILPSDPAAALSSPRADQRLPTPLDESDARTLINLAKSEALTGGPSQMRAWAILELTYACGLRVSEVCALDVSSLNREALTVRVLGKGNKERVVPYGPPAEDALDHWLVRGRPQLAGETSGSALFLGDRGGRIDPRVVRSMVHRMAAKAGVHRHCAPRAAPLDGHAPPPGRSRPARRPGDVRPRLACHDAALHPRGYRQAQRHLPARPPPCLTHAPASLTLPYPRVVGGAGPARPLTTAQRAALGASSDARPGPVSPAPPRSSLGWWLDHR